MASGKCIAEQLGLDVDVVVEAALFVLYLVVLIAVARGLINPYMHYKEFGRMYITRSQYKNLKDKNFLYMVLSEANAAAALVFVILVIMLLPSPF